MKKIEKLLQVHVIRLETTRTFISSTCELTTERALNSYNERIFRIDRILGKVCLGNLQQGNIRIRVFPTSTSWSHKLASLNK